MYPFFQLDECIFEFFFFKLVIDRSALNTDCNVIHHVKVRHFCVFWLFGMVFCLHCLILNVMGTLGGPRASGFLPHNSIFIPSLFKLNRLNVIIGVCIWRKREKNMKRNYVGRKITRGMSKTIVERRLIWISRYPIPLPGRLYLIVLLWRYLFCLSVSFLNWLAKVLL